MANMKRRQAISSAVARGLASKSFADRFETFGPDNERIILVALPDDRVADLVQQVLSVGGSANVVAPLFDGLVCFVMRPTPDTEAAGSQDVDGACTVGVMLARLAGDGGTANYTIRDGEAAGGVAQHPRILQTA